MLLSLFVFLVFNIGVSAEEITLQSADCSKLASDLSLFQLKNKKNQEANLNFIQQVSQRLRDSQSAISDDVQMKLEEKEKSQGPLTLKVIAPVLNDSLEPMSKMANETDDVLNAAYDNNDTISGELDALIKQIQDCIPQAPVKLDDKN